MPAPTTGTPTIQTAWRLDLDQDLTNGGGTWVQLKGAVALAPVINPSTGDTTDFDAAGWGGDSVTLRKAQVTGTVQRKLYSGAFDVGQEFLRTRSEDLAQFHYRIYERFANGEAYDGWATSQWTPGAGGPADLITSDFTLLGQGIRNIIANPNGVGVVPIVTSVSPVTGLAAGGSPAVSIFGSGFLGTIPTTGVKFGGTNATSWFIVNDAQIVAIPPAHGAGAVAVVVTNATGPSTTGGTPYLYT